MPSTNTSPSTEPESWETVLAGDVKVGDVVRTSTGDIVLVSRIEPAFLGRPHMLAFIEDTHDRWYKRPVMVDAEVEVRPSSRE